jgi:hypothetical protein
VAGLAISIARVVLAALAGKVTSQSVQDVEYHYPTGDFTKNNRNPPAGVGNDDPNSGRAEDASQDPAALSQDASEEKRDNLTAALRGQGETLTSIQQALMQGWTCANPYQSLRGGIYALHQNQRRMY